MSVSDSKLLSALLVWIKYKLMPLNSLEWSREEKLTVSYSVFFSVFLACINFGISWTSRYVIVYSIPQNTGDIIQQLRVWKFVKQFLVSQIFLVSSRFTVCLKYTAYLCEVIIQEANQSFLTGFYNLAQQSWAVEYLVEKVFLDFFFTLATNHWH